MTPRTRAGVSEQYAMGVVRDTHSRLANVEDHEDFTETAEALGPLAAHLAAPWFEENEEALLDFLQQQHPEQDIQNGLALAKHDLTDEDIPACPWPTPRSSGRTENLKRGRPDRKRANGAVNIAEGEQSEDPRHWRNVQFLKWLGLLLKDEAVGKTRLAVAVAVGYHADFNTGAGAYASRQTIGREVGIEARRVSTHVNALVAAGWLRDTGRRHGQNGSIEYHLSTPGKP